MKQAELRNRLAAIPAEAARFQTIAAAVHELRRLDTCRWGDEPLPPETEPLLAAVERSAEFVRWAAELVRLAAPVSADPRLAVAMAVTALIRNDDLIEARLRALRAVRALSACARA
jgi:hypothetical protein